MRLKILADNTIGEVQEKFSTLFPYLKIEFIRNIRSPKKIPSHTNFFPESLKIKGAYFGKVKEGKLKFDEETTVEALEKIFLKDFNLCVQVFRKSGALWLETTATDSWTLKLQNEHGREIAEAIKEKPEREDLDFQLTRDAED